MKFKLISDGTNAGTKLIDEDTGEMVHGIQKITLNIDANELLPHISIDLINIPVEITTKANIDLLNLSGEFIKTIDKEIKIVGNSINNIVSTANFKICDKENNSLGGVSLVKWEATPEKITTDIKKYKFEESV